MPSIFLSYNSKDRAFALKLGEALTERGIKVWIDEGELRVGDSLVDRISAGLMQTDYVGIILSPNSVSSEWVNREMKAALTYEIETKHARILPILYKDCEIPLLLKEKLYVDFRNSETDVLAFVTRVSHLVETLLGQKTSNPKKEDIDKSPAKILHKKREMVEIGVWLTVSGERYQVEIPLDARVSVVKNHLVDELGVMKTFADGSTVPYYLYSKTQSMRLADHLTFRECGVQNNDVFFLVVEMIAG
jgi:hypothetical protein